MHSKALGSAGHWDAMPFLGVANQFGLRNACFHFSLLLPAGSCRSASALNPLPHGDANRHTIFKRKN